MSNIIGTIFVIGLIVVLIWVAVKADIQKQKTKALYLQETESLYQECLKAESKFTCESFKNSRLAIQAAGEAKDSADDAAMMGAVAVGFSAGRR